MYTSRKNTPMPKVAVCYIATGPYIHFWEKYLATARDKFLVDTVKHFYVWSDTTVKSGGDVTYLHKKWEMWPEAAKYRYRTMLQVEDELRDFDFVTFTNANTWFTNISTVSDFFDNHPFTGSGHWKTYGKSRDEVAGYLERSYWSNVPESKAFAELGEYYDAHGGWLLGGCQGGHSEAWINMCHTVTEWMIEDEQAKRKLRWNDEPYFNRYAIDEGARVLDPHKWLSAGFKGYMHLEGKDKAFGCNNYRTVGRQPVSLLKRLGLAT